MIVKGLWVALLSGIFAGLVAAAAQGLVLTPLILQAEVYEHEAIVDHSHEADDPDHAAAAGHTAGHIADHTVDHAADSDDGADWARRGMTVLADILVGVGFALVLVAAMVVRGRPIGWRSGLIWGVGGFATFVGAPALGLPPELPGMPAADLVARQTWWLATVAATGLGLAALAWGRRSLVQAGGVILLIVPHIVGAPHVEHLHSAVPAVLAAQFAVLSLAAGLLFWAVLGGVAGDLFDRWVKPPRSPAEGV